MPSNFFRKLSLSRSWNQQLISGKFESIAKLAQSVGFSAPYVTRILSLTNLAPSIIEDVINGDIPEIFTLDRLYRGILDDWNEQRKKFGFED